MIKINESTSIMFILYHPSILDYNNFIITVFLSQSIPQRIINFTTIDTTYSFFFHILHSFDSADDIMKLEKKG